MSLELVQHQNTRLNQIALDEFIENRRELKYPMTALAIKKATNILIKYPFDQQQRMVDSSILAGYRGIFPVEPEKTMTTRKTTLEQDLNNTDWAN